MQVQLLKKEASVFRLLINGKPFTFMLIELFRGNELLPLPRKLKGSTLGWHVCGGWVSYNQVKRAIKTAYPIQACT